MNQVPFLVTENVLDFIPIITAVMCQGFGHLEYPEQVNEMKFRIVKTFPCVAAFMSSLTIVLVALDRHRIIILATRTQV